MSATTCGRCLRREEELEVPTLAPFTGSRWCGTCVDRMALVALEVDVWLLGLDEPAA